MQLEEAHAPLRLLPSLPSEPIHVPELAHLYDDSLRRPGELHEAVPVTGPALRTLEQRAAEAGLPSGTAARLLIESALVRAELAAVRRSEAERQLNGVAAGAAVSARMSAAHADYVRGLRGARSGARTTVTVPVRLLARMAEVDVESALSGDLAQAVAWELAAVLSGRTMLEWALMTVLAGA